MEQQYLYTSSMSLLLKTVKRVVLEHTNHSLYFMQQWLMVCIYDCQ